MVKINQSILGKSTTKIFDNPHLLDIALTHRSLPDNNEKLTFLGDTLVSFIITHFLFHEVQKRKQNKDFKDDENSIFNGI